MSPVEGAPLLEFLEVMRRLRAECAWKAGQTHRSLARFLLEETHEAIEAMDTGDLDHLREELGDLLLQVYFHAVIAEEEGAFTLDDVAADIVDKMRRRNPHVFGSDGGPESPPADGVPLDAVAVNELWEARKAAEKQRTSVLDGLPPTLPALLLADKVLDRLERTRPDLERHPNRSPSQPERMTQPGETEEVGERLLAIVADARREGVDPEQALREAVRRRIGAVDEQPDAGTPPGAPGRRR